MTRLKLFLSTLVDRVTGFPPVRRMKGHWDQVVLLVCVLIGLTFISAAVIHIERDATKHEAQTHKKELEREHKTRALAERVQVEGEEHAENVVIDSEREGCVRGTQNVIDDMNSWGEVAQADFTVAASPETKLETAAIRRKEAEGINSNELDRAKRVDYRFAHLLTDPAWRAAAERAHFSCDKAFPFP
jgi:hypothetical protein